jgi:hypothetical protein
VVLGIIAFALEHKTIRERPEIWAMALGLALQVALLAFFILQRPVTIYLLSIAATAPVLALVILKLFEPRPALARALTVALTLIILAGYLGSFAQSLVAQRSKAARITQIVQQTDDSLKSFAQSTGRSPADLFALWSYRSYSPCFALWFANDSTGRAFRREIGDICYRQYQFNVWAQKVVSSQGVRALADAKWDVIIGCEDGFATGGLEVLPHVDTFPSLKLECGSLKIAYNRP